MINRKLKHRNCQAGMIMNKVYDANLRNIFTAAVCLYHSGQSKKKVSEMMDVFYKETVPYWNDKAEADVHSVKIKERLGKMKLPIELVERTVNVLCREVFQTLPLRREVVQKLSEELTESVAVFLIQVNDSFGYGEKRLRTMLQMMQEYKGDAIQEGKKLFNQNFDDDNGEIIDITKVISKPSRPLNYYETKRKTAELEGLRRFQETVVKNKIGGAQNETN